MEVLKTHVCSRPCTVCYRTDLVVIKLAANRADKLRNAISKTWARGGISAYYQGLIPWVGSKYRFAPRTYLRGQGIDKITTGLARSLHERLHSPPHVQRDRTPRANEIQRLPNNVRYSRRYRWRSCPVLPDDGNDNVYEDS